MTLSATIIDPLEFCGEPVHALLQRVDFGHRHRLIGGVFLGYFWMIHEASE